jgi:LAS superfamily LD-carboxypeptidase LdcB
MLNRFELTGRATTHVRELSQPQCILHELAGEALLRMRNAALTDGIQLEVVSSFRDFKRQVAIWTAKFNGERPLLDRSGREIRREELDETGLIDSILIWSALPGASRHHWGSEIDVIDAAALPAGVRPRLVPAEYAPDGCFGRLSGWLDSNMGKFGFFRPYVRDRGGVQPEPWHLSFAAVSIEALELMQMDVLREALGGADMPGKEGVLSRLPELYERYVVAVDSP